MQEQEININVSGDTKELVIRQGNAEKLHEPKVVEKTGSITAPRQYLENKIDQYSPDKSTLYVDRDVKSIVLKLQEKDPFGDTISGHLVESEELKVLQINKDKRWTVQELKRILKQVRFMFANPEENLEIIKALDKFNATVTTNLTQHSSNRGDTLNAVERTVGGIEWRNFFTLNIPIFKGGEKNTFSVEIAVDATDANVRFFLDSPDLYDLQAKVLDEVLEEEVAFFRDWNCSIVIIS